MILASCNIYLSSRLISKSCSRKPMPLLYRSMRKYRKCNDIKESGQKHQKLSCSAILSKLYWRSLAFVRSTQVHNTVECRFNAVQYYKILHKWLQELGQNVSQMLDPRRHPMGPTPYLALARYGMPLVNICEKIDCIITAPHCILKAKYTLRRLPCDRYSSHLWYVLLAYIKPIDIYIYIFIYI